MDGYFDDMGNRIRLDTRNLEWCGQHKLVKKKRKIGKTIFKIALCIFCGWFAICHIDVFISNILPLIEAFGVLACLGFIAGCLSELL